MEYAIRDKIYLRKDRYRLVSINRCRLYLQCFYVSKLMNERGYVCKKYLTGEESRRDSDIHIPPIQKPTPLEFSEWKDFIFHNFLAGPFKVHPPIQELQATQLYHAQLDEMTILRSIVNKRKTLQQILEETPDALKVLMGVVDIPSDDGETLANAMMMGELIGASDGSVIQVHDEDVGGHSFTLQSRTVNDYKTQGKGPTPTSDSINSTTTEHYGFLGMLVTVYIITMKFDITTSKPIVMLSVSKETIKRMKDIQPPINLKDT